MISETSRINEHPVSEMFENKTDFERPVTITSEETTTAQETQTQLSYFFIELFVCSLLLWSLLFISQSEWGTRVSLYVGNLLEEECSIQAVQAFEGKLEEAIKQMI